MPKRTFNAKQLAAIMSVSKHTVYVWAREKKIPYLRVGRGHLRFNAAEVLQAIRHADATAA
jgi:excisionase family DNA binding protein